MTLDLTKPVQLTDGRPVRIICTDAKGEWPIVGLVNDLAGVVWAAMFRHDGMMRSYTSSPINHLQNIPPPARIVWINVYADWVGQGTFNSRRQADNGQCHDRSRSHLLQVNLDTGETNVHAPCPA